MAWLALVGLGWDWLAWLGLARPGLAWHDWVRRGLVWLGLSWLGLAGICLLTCLFSTFSSCVRCVVVVHVPVGAVFVVCSVM